MGKYFKLFKATAPKLKGNLKHMSEVAYKSSQTSIAKRGIIGTIGATGGAAAGSYAANDRSDETRSDIKRGAMAGAALGLGVTAAVLARGPLGRVASAAGAGVTQGVKVFFRRVRGRIVPMRVK
jgi:hypothetical protein